MHRVLIVAAVLAGRGAGLPPTGGATLIGHSTTGAGRTGPERRDLRLGEREDLCAQALSVQVKMADAGRDTKLFPVCAPWSGDKGRGFTHVFAVEFPAGLARIKDHYSSLKQHLEGKDFGGISPPTPAQLAANPNHVNDPRPHPGAGGGGHRVGIQLWAVGRPSLMRQASEYVRV